VWFLIVVMSLQIACNTMSEGRCLINIDAYWWTFKLNNVFAYCSLEKRVVVVLWNCNMVQKEIVELWLKVTNIPNQFVWVLHFALVAFCMTKKIQNEYKLSLFSARGGFFCNKLKQLELVLMKKCNLFKKNFITAWSGA
jgi:hypothetical protein